MKMKKIKASKEKEHEVIRVYPDKKIPDHGIFERQNSGIIWQVLNYKDHYAIWEGSREFGYRWSNDKRLKIQTVFQFSLKPSMHEHEKPCFKTLPDKDPIIKCIQVIICNNPSFYVKNINTGNIYIVNTNETAELLYTDEKEFVRTQEFLNR